MTDTDLVDRLTKHPILGAAPRAELEWLAAHGTLRCLEAGDPLSTKGTPVSATRSSQSRATRTSARTKTAVTPAAAIAAATVRPRASSRPVTATFAPSSAKRIAAASPRPDVAPVMMATRSLSFIAGSAG